MSSLKERLSGYAKICRLEYVPAEAPAIFIPLLLVAESPTHLLNVIYLEAILVFILLYFSGFIVNSLTDIEVDKKFKTFVAKGVEEFGEKSMKYLLVVHLSLGVILTIHISMVTGKFILIPLVLIGIFLGIGYSVKPFHFKVRGVFHFLALWPSALLIPFLFLYISIASEISFIIILLGFGFSIAHYGIALINQAQDMLEDKESGLKTPAVRWGIKNTLNLAVGMMFVGLVLIGTSYYFLLISSGYLSEISQNMYIQGGLAAGITAIILMPGYYVPVKGTFDLLEIIDEHNKDVELMMDKVKKKINYPKWQASGIYSLLVITIIVFSCQYASKEVLTSVGDKSGKESLIEIISLEGSIYERYDVEKVQVYIRIKNNAGRDIEPGEIRVSGCQYLNSFGYINITPYYKSIKNDKSVLDGEVWEVSMEFIVYKNNLKASKIEIMLYYDDNMIEKHTLYR